MTDESAKPFQFDLAETLFFHRNEGVSEMLGIGLDPEISIESHPDHVSIRGIIALTGEYLPVFVEDRSDVDDQDEIQARYFKRVERDEDGVCEFLHHFPIDISIPHERVNNLEDLTVSIDHFDYHVPHARKLELEATVQINGLGYQQADKEDTEEILPNDDELDNGAEDEERIYFDIKVKDEDEPESSEVEEESVSEAVEDEEDNLVQLTQRAQLEPIEDDYDAREELDVNIEESKSSKEELADEEEKERVQETTYLLDLFDQVEEEDRYSQLKMYIVQDDDSLEEIANKYEVSLAKLQRANQIETTSVHQGQIIYVPK